MSIKTFIQKKAWFDYSVHNPFRTKKQVEEAAKYADIYGWSSRELPKYSDLHPKEDELLAGLKAMLEPKQSTFRRLSAKTLYCLQRFIRKYTDVTAPIFRPRTKEELEATKRIDEIDKKNVTHWDEYQAAHEARCKEWKMKEEARKLSERCFIVKPDQPYRRH